MYAKSGTGVRLKTAPGLRARRAFHPAYESMKDCTMRRRELNILLGTAVAYPFAARAQQQATPVIGFLHAASPEQNVERLASYRKGLSDAGFVEGQNVTITFRWAEGHADRLPEMAADLIRRQVAVIATAGSTDAALAAKSATSTIPIVFGAGGDPVTLGLVTSLNRPGGNVTGVTSMNADIAAKRLGLLRELAPQATRYFALVNPTSVLADPFIKELQAGAAKLGIHAELLHASNDAAIDAAFAQVPHQSATVLVVNTDAFFFSRRTEIARRALDQQLPTMFDNREYAAAGGLVSYGADFLNVMQSAGVYTGRILRGEKPADLPVMQSTKYEFVINLKTAKSLGIKVSDNLLSLADETIE
ncbi:MAG: ABC transporter substrate-binding protein [Xanthobacteraceae bacterium]